jgi:hypothetical protein
MRTMREIEFAGGAPFNPPHLINGRTKRCDRCGMTLKELVTYGGPPTCPAGYKGVTMRADKQNLFTEQVIYEYDAEAKRREDTPVSGPKGA